MRIRVIPREDQYVLLSLNGYHVMTHRDVVDSFMELVRRAKPRGRWQARVLLWLAEAGRVPASAGRMLRGAAAQYTGKYQRSLEAIMERAGAVFHPGPRGGRWCGYYALPKQPSQ